VNHDRPTAAELVQAVQEFLEQELVPNVADPRLRFRTLVALTALGIVGRELGEQTSDTPTEEQLALLLREIRAGTPPPDALALLKRHVRAKLVVASPRALARYE
jgi:hypothetical protein